MGVETIDLTESPSASPVKPAPRRKRKAATLDDENAFDPSSKAVPSTAKAIDWTQDEELAEKPKKKKKTDPNEEKRLKR